MRKHYSDRAISLAVIPAVPSASSAVQKIRIAVANRNVTWPPGKAVYVPRADPAGNTWKIHSRYGDSDGKLEWGGVDDDALIDEV